MSPEMQCPACGALVEAGAECPSCGMEVSTSPDVRWGQATRQLQTKPPPAPPAKPDAGASTLFQPSIMFGSILDGEVSDAGVPAGAVTQASTTPDSASRGPSMRLEVPAYFLVVGAPPGFERVELREASTVFGREGADLVLDDPKASSRHCQIDAMGREFFVRDLDSLNGTYLNGHKIRSSEIRAGDSLRIGKTTLVFCVGEDATKDTRG